MKSKEEIQQEYIIATENTILDVGDYSDWLENQLIWMTAERNRQRNKADHFDQQNAELKAEVDRLKEAANAYIKKLEYELEKELVEGNSLDVEGLNTCASHWSEYRSHP